jgi:c-di-AMP phosphodiesterase-like protein
MSAQNTTGQIASELKAMVLEAFNKIDTSYRSFARRILMTEDYDQCLVLLKDTMELLKTVEDRLFVLEQEPQQQPQIPFDCNQEVS